MKIRLNWLLFAAGLMFAAGTVNAQEATPVAQAAEPTTEAAPQAIPQTDTVVNSSYRADPEWMPKRDPQKGLLIVFRESRFVGGGVKIKLFSDGTALPPVKNGSYMYTYLEPGDHKIYSDKKKQRDARILEVEPGEVYFFEASIAMGVWKGSIDLLESDAEIAKQKIAGLKKPAAPKAK